MMHEIQFRREVEIRRSGEDSGLDKAVLGIRGWRRFRTTHLGAEDDDDTLADAFGAVGRWTTSDFKDFCQAVRNSRDNCSCTMTKRCYSGLPRFGRVGATTTTATRAE